MAFTAIIRADGNPKYMMRSMMIGAGLNVILDPIFIFALNLGTAGAAIATVISQCISFSILLYFFFSKKYNGLNPGILNTIFVIGCNLR